MRLRAADHDAPPNKNGKCSIMVRMSDATMHEDAVYAVVRWIQNPELIIENQYQQSRAYHGSSNKEE